MKRWAILLFILTHAAVLIHRREKDEFMSLGDNNSEVDHDRLSTPPTSPLYGLPMLDDHSTPFSKRYIAIRRARSTAVRYSAYKVPSREQRYAFIRNSCRKEMFIDGLHDAFIPPAEPGIIHPMAGFALPSMRVDIAAPHVEEHEHHTDIPHEAQSKSDLTIIIPSAVDRLGLQFLDSCIVSELTGEDKENEGVVDYATQDSSLTIKIPALVDRLALRLLGSCNVNDQTAKGGDEGDSSLNESTASESSSSSDDSIDDYHTSPSYTLKPVLTAVGPDRTSRRKHRRIATPYRRAEGKPKRKELWVDTDIMLGSEVPAFLLESLASVLSPDRHC